MAQIERHRKAMDTWGYLRYRPKLPVGKMVRGDCSGTAEDNKNRYVVYVESTMFGR